MEITIKEAETIAALTAHIRLMGITGEINSMSFTKSKSEQQLITTVDVGVATPNIAVSKSTDMPTPISKPVEVVKVAEADAEIAQEEPTEVSMDTEEEETSEATGRSLFG